MIKRKRDTERYRMREKDIERNTERENYREKGGRDR